MSLPGPFHQTKTRYRADLRFTDPRSPPLWANRKMIALGPYSLSRLCLDTVVNGLGDPAEYEQQLPQYNLPIDMTEKCVSFSPKEGGL